MNDIFEYEMKYDKDFKDFYVTYKSNSYFNPRKSLTELTNTNKRIAWKEKKTNNFFRNDRMVRI